MRFRYKAKSGTQIVEGVKDADSKYDLYNALKAEGYEIVYIKEFKESKFSLSYLNKLFSTVPKIELVNFASNLATMLKAGLSLSRALQIARKQTKNGKMQIVIENIQKDIEEGKQFHEALARYKSLFSELFVSLVKAGEISGDLPHALESVAKQIGKSVKLRKKIQSAMIYPSIIIFAIFAIGAFMMIYVVPKISDIFKEMNAELPYATKLIIWISDILYAYSKPVAIFVLSLFVLFTWFLRREVGKALLSKALLKIPIINSLSREINSAYTARTLSSLLSSGVPVIESINIGADVVQNREFRRALKHIAKQVEKGKSFSEAIREYDKLYPTMFVELVAVGEETGQISGMLDNLAEYYEDEVSRKTKDMSTIVEPFLMLFIGAAVGYFAYAMIVPMYTITSKF